MKNMEDRIKKVCFIGNCGHSKQAYKCLKTRKDTHLCGIAPESEHENMAASPYTDIPFYSDYQKMLDDTHPDLVIVSPVFAHTGQVIINCAKKGIDVFSEKPVAASFEELEAVRSAVKNSNIKFCAMHYLRYAPAFYHGAQLVRNGEIGEVRMVTAQKSYKYGTRPAWYGDRTLYCGTIPWVGIHAIDWMYHFTGKRFTSVSSQCFGKDPEMAAICQFEMEDGVLGAVNIDYYRPKGALTHGDDRVRCVGTKGVLEVRDGNIYLSTENINTVITPTEAPDLLGEFIDGKETISPEEIFYLTKVAITARDSLNRKQEIKVGG